MQKIKLLLILFFFFCFSGSLYAALPLIEPGAVVEEPSAEVAALLIIFDAWHPNIEQYKEINSDPKLILEEFNLIAIIHSKSGVSLSQIWKWRKMKLEWQSIVKKCGLTLDDVVPRSEKKFNEPYLFSYTYWREKGDPKKVFSLTDYNFEKLGEVFTLSKYSEKKVDMVIDEIIKGGSFRQLSLNYYKEKTKKVKRK